MSRLPEQPAEKRSTLEREMRDGGWARVQELAQEVTDPLDKVRLISLATRVASGELRREFSLDRIVEINQMAIAEALALSSAAESEGDAERALAFKQQANVMAYNFAADLAPCWPDDQEPRSTVQHQIGAAIARQSLRWRIELDKGPESLALAYWAIGIHELALRNAREAFEAFSHALQCAQQAAEAFGSTSKVESGGDYMVLLNFGFRGIARWLEEDTAGRDELQEALAAFEAMTDETERGSDAAFGRAQLLRTCELLGLSLPARQTDQV